MFPCLPSIREFLTTTDSPFKNDDPFLAFQRKITSANSTDDTDKASVCKSDQTKNKKISSSVILKLDTGSGALQLPTYSRIPRDSCPLLRHCWGQNWEKVIEICALEPHRALHTTEHSGRTALHLAIFNRRCPLHVARALLTANRHMILVQDDNLYTPLHMLAYFSNTKPTGESSVSSISTFVEGESRDDPQVDLVELFCDTAVMVEQELQNDTLIPTAWGTSPLFLAAKRNAPLELLKTLLHTRERTVWIAPSTGGEPYWDSQTMDEYSSPLEVLLRDSNRASTLFGSDLLLRDSMLRVEMRNMAYRRLARRRGGFRGEDYTSGSSPENAVYLPQGNDKRYHASDQSKMGCVLPDLLLDDQTMRDSMIDLWEKCIEFLVPYCPLLEVGEDTSHIPYGVLHAATSCKVPIPSLVQLVATLFPEQNMQRDEQGMIPLHHVLRCNHKYATRTLLNILLPEDCTGELGSRLVSNTTLVRFPNDGPTPLAFALFNGLPIDPVVEKLLAADSDTSLNTLDLSTHLYPFCVAAMQNNVLVTPMGDTGRSGSSDELSELDQEKDLARLNTCYRLLRAHPQVIGQLFAM